MRGESCPAEDEMEDLWRVMKVVGLILAWLALNGLLAYGSGQVFIRMLDSKRKVVRRAGPGISFVLLLGNFIASFFYLPLIAANRVVAFFFIPLFGMSLIYSFIFCLRAYDPSPERWRIRR